MDRLGRSLDIALVVFGVLGLAVLAALWAAPPLRVGEGQLRTLAYALETLDFKTWLVAGVLLTWLVPVALGLLWRRSRALGFQHDRLSDALDRLTHLSMPVKVDVDTRVPVRVAEPLAVPVELDTRIDLDQDVHVEVQVPVHAEIPVDTEVETQVPMIGAVRVPVRARIPVDLVLPVNGTVRVRAQGIPVQVREVARVRLPEFDLPFSARLDTRVELLAGLAGDEETPPARTTPAPV